MHMLLAMPLIYEPFMNNNVLFSVAMQDILTPWYGPRYIFVIQRREV